MNMHYSVRLRPVHPSSFGWIKHNVDGEYHWMGMGKQNWAKNK